MKEWIDLRSDTVTRPTQAMRKVIADAQVGDDVFGEDPSVNRLQDRVAELLGKEASLFMPSGTMCNQIAINVHTRPGDEVLCDVNSHIMNYEGGGPARLSGVQLFPLHGENGIIHADQVKSAIRKKNPHFPTTRLVEIENTHNRGGGNIFPIDEIEMISRIAKDHGLALHMDGARLWNAHVATGIPLQNYTRHCDSVSVCMSKGLGAPVGSLLAGDQGFIENAVHVRKVFGGGMRQAGIIAAAGLYALEHNLPRLEIDHVHAKMLAQELCSMGADVDLKSCQTNIVIADFKSFDVTAEDLANRLREKALLALPVKKYAIRFVLHLEISEKMLKTAIKRVKECLRL